MNYVKTAMLLAALTAVFMGLGYLMGGVGGMAIAFLFAVGTNAYAFWNSDKMALRMHNAEPATKASHPELVEMVERLSHKAGLPVPAVYVLHTDQPNAFATGRSPENAAVAATTGIMKALSYEELEGVMAHELAHVQNRDTLIMTVAATVAGAISMIANFGLWFGGGRERGGFIAVLAAAILAPFAAMLIQMLISRTREYAADRRAAEITGNPRGLASALKKIGMLAGRIEMPSAERNPASAHLFIANPLTGARMDSLFSTHPSMENRIAALMNAEDDIRASSMRQTSIPTVRRQ